jgi:hypothetical protein
MNENRTTPGGMKEIGCISIICSRHPGSASIKKTASSTAKTVFQLVF